MHQPSDRSSSTARGHRRSRRERPGSGGVRLSGRGTQVARAVGARTDVPHPGRGGHHPTQVLRAGHVPVPQRRRLARRTSRGIHCHRHRGTVQAHARFQRVAPDGVGCVRPAGGTVRAGDRHAPVGDHRAQH
eukprot:ctg_1265.g457